MPYFLTTDQFADDPIWEVLAEGKTAMVDALKASYIDLNAKASHLLTNGYLTEQTALRYCRGRRKVLQLLTKKVLGREPLLHRKDDECACLDDEWIPGYEFRIHKFLKRNPSKREYERDRAQKADLRDSRLKALVYERDGGCCRYCRSGVLNRKSGRNKDRRKVLQFDHVDPDQAAKPDGEGLVVACARCNEFKGHRTPEEADMVLLPAPTDEQKAAWAARGVAVFDMPTDHPPINDGSTTEQQTNADPTNNTTGDPNAAQHHTSTDEPAHEQGEHGHDQHRAWSAKGPGWVGQRPSSDPPTGPPRHSSPQPPRSPDSPDIYHRRSRAPGTPTRTPHAPPEEASPS